MSIRLLTWWTVLISLVVSCSTTSPPISESLVAELEAELSNVFASGSSPSIQVAVVSGDQIIWSQAFGQNTSVDHVYMNASVQKVFTSVAVLQLVEKGILDLDTDVQQYVPFSVGHPDFPETPITIRLLLAHRSGLDSFQHQFDWDTGAEFSPQYRHPGPETLLTMGLEEFLRNSFEPDGSNYDRTSWIFEPGSGYRYSVSTYPFLRYLIGHVTGQSYPEYMREHLFALLGMTHSGFSSAEFFGRHAIPFTRADGSNIELPIWNGQGWMMRTTAEDMARFMLALMNDGRHGASPILQPETMALMRKRTTRFKVLFRGSEELPSRGHGLGLNLFRGGWFGYGGSAPGFQTLWRYNHSKRIGYVIMSNVNAILVGGANYASARKDIYEVQDALISILDPTFGLRSRLAEIGIVAALALYAIIIGFWVRRRRAKQPVGDAPTSI